MDDSGMYDDLPEMSRLLSELPFGHGYDCYWPYKAKTNITGLYAQDIKALVSLTQGRGWGWHFDKDRLVVLTFESRTDASQVRLGGLESDFASYMRTN